DKRKFDDEEKSDEQFCSDPTGLCGKSSPSGFLVRLNVHDFAEDVRVHCEERTEEKGLPGKLRNVVDPTAENEDEQIARLNEDVEGRATFESNGTSVVNVNSQQHRGKPKSDAPAGVNPENAKEWDLPRGDLPTKRAELLIDAARAE